MNLDILTLVDNININNEKKSEDSIIPLVSGLAISIFVILKLGFKKKLPIIITNSFRPESFITISVMTIFFKILFDFDWFLKDPMLEEMIELVFEGDDLELFAKLFERRLMGRDNIEWSQKEINFWNSLNRDQKQVLLNFHLVSPEGTYDYPFETLPE